MKNLIIKKGDIYVFEGTCTNEFLYQERGIERFRFGYDGIEVFDVDKKGALGSFKEFINGKAFQEIYKNLKIDKSKLVRGMVYQSIGCKLTEISTFWNFQSSDYIEKLVIDIYDKCNGDFPKFLEKINEISIVDCERNEVGYFISFRQDLPKLPFDLVLLITLNKSKITLSNFIYKFLCENCKNILNRYLNCKLNGILDKKYPHLNY